MPQTSKLSNSEVLRALVVAEANVEFMSEVTFLRKLAVGKKHLALRVVCEIARNESKATHIRVQDTLARYSHVTNLNPSAKQRCSIAWATTRRETTVVLRCKVHDYGMLLQTANGVGVYKK
jgi:hypothetical protein